MSLEAFDRHEELVEVIELVEYGCRATLERLGPHASGVAAAQRDA